jgi:hypothetical protein
MVNTNFGVKLVICLKALPFCHNVCRLICEYGCHYCLYFYPRMVVVDEPTLSMVDFDFEPGSSVVWRRRVWTAKILRYGDDFQAIDFVGEKWHLRYSGYNVRDKVSDKNRPISLPSEWQLDDGDCTLLHHVDSACSTPVVKYINDGDVF